MQSKRFKSKMALAGDTYNSLAKELKIHRITLSDKVEGIRSQFKQDEIHFFINHWNLTPHELVQIFFDEESPSEC